MSYRHWLYGGAAVLFLGHQLAERGFGWRQPWLDNYLDPLLAMPLLLGLWQWERSRRYGWPRLHPVEIALFTLIGSLLFELGFPRWSDGFTADAGDVVAYLAGSCLFWWFNGSAPDHSRLKA